MNLTKNRGWTSEGEGAPAPLVAYPPIYYIKKYT
jgi:hypothetical protein